MNKRRRQILAIGLILIGVLLLFSRAKKYPDVILITIDALRADHLSCYGYKRLTSPNIDRLAKDGVIFRNCYAVTTSTINAFPAMLTGRYLINYFDETEAQLNVLSENFTTLAEYLKKLGYQTAAFSGNTLLNPGSGFEQGFADYDSPNTDTLKITEKVLNYLRLHLPRKRKPLFLWVHYLDPHAPYTPPREYERLFRHDSLYRQSDEIWAASIPVKYDHLLLVGAFSGYRYPLNELISRYDGEINFVDYNLGRILQLLPKDAMVIISADHGENLGENDQYRHSFISEQTLQIPLIIKDNRYFKGGKNIFAAVSSVDIVPTVLNTVNRINYFFTKGMFQGINLSGLLKNDKGKRKYIYSYKPPLAIIRDVNKNLALPSLDYEGYKRADQPAYLKQELKKWLKDNPTPSSLNPRRPDLDNNSLEALRSLGYMQ